MDLIIGTSEVERNTYYFRLQKQSRLWSNRKGARSRFVQNIGQTDTGYMKKLHKKSTDQKSEELGSSTDMS